MINVAAIRIKPPTTATIITQIFTDSSSLSFISKTFDLKAKYSTE